MAFILPSLSRKRSRIETQAAELVAAPITQTVGFFDLVGSTSAKLRKGHTRGVHAAMVFTLAARSVVHSYRGAVVKELGDGVLCRFSDPLSACRAALTLKALCPELGLMGRFGLALGRLSRYSRTAGNEDVFGAPVDRCARIQAAARPQQVLIDDPLHEAVRSHLVEHPEVLASDALPLDAKDIGLINVRELSLRGDGLANRLSGSFRAYPQGRLTIAEKVRFARNAKSEVLEIGTGLTAFAKSFTGQRPGEFQDHIAALVRRGVSVKCYAVDPHYEPAQRYLRECGDRQYESDILRARKQILAERRRLLACGTAGSLEYYVYSRIPFFHCLCCDSDDPADGSMLFSYYLPGVPRASCPVYLISRASEPELYDKHLASVRLVQQHSREIEA